MALHAFKSHAKKEFVTTRKCQANKSLNREALRDEALRFATISSGV